MHAAPSSRRTVTLGLCLTVLVSQAGCGLLFTNGPPTGHEQMVGFSCTESNTGPILDVVWAGLSVAGALVAASQSESDFYYEDVSQGAVIAVNLGWGLLSGASAAVGFNKTKQCREAKMAMYRRLQEANTLRGTAAVVRAVRVAPLVDTLRVGEQRQLLAVAYTSAGTPIPGTWFRWSSSNDAIASVSDAGLVTAHAEGKVVIAANADNVVGTASMVVTP